MCSQYVNYEEVLMDKAISQNMLDEFKADFGKDISSAAAMNAVTANGLCSTARSFDAVRSAIHSYSVELPQHGITWQKNSGRCWMYSGFNFLRDRVISKLDLDDFAFSGNYLMFYDKLEKANFYLEKVLEHIEEPPDSRMMMSLVRGLRSDGGEWEMFVSLVQKYGIVPKEAQPETVSTDNSRTMAPVVAEKLREYGRDLHRLYASGKTVAELRAEKDEMLSTIYRMYCICYGEPVKTFDFKVRSKKGEFICSRGITPKEFYDKYVSVDLDQYVNLTCGSSGGSQLKKYRYPDVGNVVGGKDICYVSVPINTLKEAAIAQLTDGEPVWFGCDVGERSWREGGILDDRIYSFNELFSTSFDMSKADRFYYHQAHMSHAMTFKGVDLDDSGSPLWWRVENSWGPDVGSKGMFVMSDSWFDKYTYQVIINRKHLSDAILRVYDGDDAIVLDKWQPNI